MSSSSRPPTSLNPSQQAQQALAAQIQARKRAEEARKQAEAKKMAEAQKAQEAAAAQAAAASAAAGEIGKQVTADASYRQLDPSAAQAQAAAGSGSSPELQSQVEFKAQGQQESAESVQKGISFLQGLLAVATGAKTEAKDRTSSTSQEGASSVTHENQSTAGTKDGVYTRSREQSVRRESPPPGAPPTALPASAAAAAPPAGQQAAAADEKKPKPGSVEVEKKTREDKLDLGSYSQTRGESLETSTTDTAGNSSKLTASRQRSGTVDWAGGSASVESQQSSSLQASDAAGNEVQQKQSQSRKLEASAKDRRVLFTSASESSSSQQRVEQQGEGRQTIRKEESSQGKTQQVGWNEGLRLQSAREQSSSNQVQVVQESRKRKKIVTTGSSQKSSSSTSVEGGQIRHSQASEQTTSNSTATTWSDGSTRSKSDSTTVASSTSVGANLREGTAEASRSRIKTVTESRSKDGVTDTSSQAHGYTGTAKADLLQGTAGAELGRVDQVTTGNTVEDGQGGSVTNEQTEDRGPKGSVRADFATGQVDASFSTRGATTQKKQTVAQTADGGTSSTTDSTTNKPLSFTGGYGPEGVNAGATWGSESSVVKEHKDAQGEVVKTEEQKRSAQYSLGGTFGSDSVAANAGVGLTQGKSSLSAQAEVVWRDNTSFARNKGADGLPAAGFLVTSTETLGAKGSVSAGHEASKTQCFNIGIGLGGSSSTEWARQRDDLTANQIYEGKKSEEAPSASALAQPIPGQAVEQGEKPKLGVDQVLQAPGDKLTYTRKGTVSATVSGKVGAFSGGVQVAAEGTWKTEVERLPDGKVKLTYTPEDVSKLSVFAGDSVGFVEVRADGSKTQSLAQSFEFDLNSDAGRKAFQQALDGKLPGALDQQAMQGDAATVARRFQQEARQEGVRRLGATHTEALDVSLTAKGGLPWFQASISSGSGEENVRTVDASKADGSVSVTDRNKEIESTKHGTFFTGDHTTTSAAQVSYSTSVDKQGKVTESFNGIQATHVIGDSDTDPGELNERIDQLNRTGLKPPIRHVQGNENWGESKVVLSADVTPKQVDQLMQVDPATVAGLSKEQQTQLSQLQTEMRSARTAAETQNAGADPATKEARAQAAAAEAVQDRLKADAVGWLGILNKAAAVDPKVTSASTRYTDALAAADGVEVAHLHRSSSDGKLTNALLPSTIDGFSARQTALREQVSALDEARRRLDQDPLMSQQDRAQLAAQLDARKARFETALNLGNVTDKKKVELFQKLENQYYVNGGEFDTMKEVAASVSDPAQRAEMVRSLARGSTPGRYQELMTEIVEKTPAKDRKALFQHLDLNQLRGELSREQFQSVANLAMHEAVQSKDSATVAQWAAYASPHKVEALAVTAIQNQDWKTVENLINEGSLGYTDVDDALGRIVGGMTPQQLEAMPKPTKEQWIDYLDNYYSRGGSKATETARKLLESSMAP